MTGPQAATPSSEFDEDVAPEPGLPGPQLEGTSLPRSPGGPPTDEFVEDTQPSPEPFSLPQAPFNLEKWREFTRAGLAILLTALLGAVVLIFVIAGINQYPSEEAKEYLGLILSPLVGLVGAATGFYYGGGGKDNK